MMVTGTNVGYRIQMEGNDEQELQVLFFKEIPGHYLFLLSEKEIKEVTEYIEQTKVVTVEVLVTIQTEAADETDPYDASTLSIVEIPEKLLNYLDNRYELQYRLYDYLYRNGYRDVKEVTIDGYEIDPEERKAEFTIRISKGSSITGIYLKDGNAYSFY